jgi:hypothetical protein
MHAVRDRITNHIHMGECGGLWSFRADGQDQEVKEAEENGGMPYPGTAMMNEIGGEEIGGEENGAFEITREAIGDFKIGGEEQTP